MIVRRKMVLTILLVTGALTLSACRAEEQGRVTNFEPGVYKGKADTSLSAKQMRVLLKRTLRQSDLSIRYGGTSKKRGSDVRPPSSDAVRKMEQKLMRRAKQQSGS